MLNMFCMTVWVWMAPLIHKSEKTVSVNVGPCSLLSHKLKLTPEPTLNKKSQDCSVMMYLVKKQDTKRIWKSWKMLKYIFALWARNAQVISLNVTLVQINKLYYKISHWLKGCHTWHAWPFFFRSYK